MRTGTYSDEDREIVSAVGDRLRKLRSDMGLSLSELSMIVGIPAHQYNAWENGHNCPRITSLVRIAQACNMSVSDLLKDL